MGGTYDNPHIQKVTAQIQKVTAQIQNVTAQIQNVTAQIQNVTTQVWNVLACATSFFARVPLACWVRCWSNEHR